MERTHEGPGGSTRRGLRFREMKIGQATIIIGSSR
jgi:hypothetical protein